MTAVCTIPNCGKQAPAGDAFCADHRDRPPLVVIDPKCRESMEPCGECHLHEGETCSICGAIARATDSHQVETLTWALKDLWLASAAGTDRERLDAMTNAGDLLARLGALEGPAARLPDSLSVSHE